MFKDDVDICPVIIDKKLSYIPWGDDKNLPYHILDLIESDETLSTYQQFNAEVCYGSGLRYNVDESTKAVKQEVEDFLLDNAVDEVAGVVHAGEWVASQKLLASLDNGSSSYRQYATAGNNTGEC